MNKIDRHWLEVEAAHAWLDLFVTMRRTGKPPSLEWAMRWAPDGTIDRLWRSSPLVIVDQVRTNLRDSSWHTKNVFLAGHGKHALLMRWFDYRHARWARRVWCAPTLELLLTRLDALDFLYGHAANYPTWSGPR